MVEVQWLGIPYYSLPLFRVKNLQVSTLDPSRNHAGLDEREANAWTKSEECDLTGDTQWIPLGVADGFGFQFWYRIP